MARSNVLLKLDYFMFSQLILAKVNLGVVESVAFTTIKARECL